MKNQYVSIVFGYMDQHIGTDEAYEKPIVVLLSQFLKKLAKVHDIPNIMSQNSHQSFRASAPTRDLEWREKKRHEEVRDGVDISLDQRLLVFVCFEPISIGGEQSFVQSFQGRRTYI